MSFETFFAISLVVASAALEMLFAVFVVDPQMSLQTSFLSRLMSANLALELLRIFVELHVLVEIALG